MKAKAFMILCSFLVLGILLTSSCSKSETSDSSFSIKASFTANYDSIAAGDTVAFTNKSQNASYYIWNFGDGSASASKNPSHIFTSNGIYSVVLVAVGNNGMDSTSLDIVVGSGSIFPGKGIAGTNLYDTWSSINTAYASSDTVHYRDYDSDYSEYIHEIYYYNLGVGFYFYTTAATLSDTDPVYMIDIISPYSGITSKGIAIGDKISKVISAYGTPTVYSGSGYYWYCYSSLGIYFYTTAQSTSAVVKAMRIFPVESSKSYQVKRTPSIPFCLYNPIKSNVR